MIHNHLKITLSNYSNIQKGLQSNHRYKEGSKVHLFPFLINSCKFQVHLLDIRKISNNSQDDLESHTFRTHMRLSYNLSTIWCLICNREDKQGTILSLFIRRITHSKCNHINLVKVVLKRYLHHILMLHSVMEKLWVDMKHCLIYIGKSLLNLKNIQWHTEMDNISHQFRLRQQDQDRLSVGHQLHGNRHF